MKKQFTLCMVCSDDQILLGMKKIGFGAGRWNGFGGKIELGESIEQGAKRELFEEAGIHAVEIEKMGTLNFSFDSEPKELEVHVFKVDKYTGEPVESNEMAPQWFSIDSIPYEEMWSDDIHWLPLLLGNEKFEGTFHFDRPSDADYSAKILKFEVKKT